MSKQKPELPELQLIAIGDIIITGDNPRKFNVNSTEFAELCQSIEAQGVKVPVHVRNTPKKKGRYELLAGERRVRAAIKIGADAIPAINHGDIDDVEAFEITYAENYARQDLTPIEQGRAVVTMFGKYKGDTQAVASKLGKSIKWVLQRKALGTKLSKTWLDGRDDDNVKDFTAAHLQIIAALPADVQDKAYSDLTYYCDGEGMTVKELSDYVTDQMQNLADAPFAKDADIAAICAKCKKRTSITPGLFDDTLDLEKVKKNDRCLDSECWFKRRLDYYRKAYDKYLKKHPDITLVTDDHVSSGWQDQAIKEVLGDTLPYYKFEFVAKTDKNAKPAFSCHGKKAGQLIWIRLYTSAGTKPKTGTQKGQPTPLKVRRELLNKKRSAKLLTELQAIVAKKKVADLVNKDKAVLVMSLANQYGVDSRETVDNYYTGRDIFKAWQQVKKWSSLTQDQIVERLFENVKPVLVKNLDYKGPVTQTPPVRIQAAKALADLFGIDVPAMEKVIEGVIPEPKAWAKLNADGTPKLTPAKAKPKKPAKDANHAGGGKAKDKTGAKKTKKKAAKKKTKKSKG